MIVSEEFFLQHQRIKLEQLLLIIKCLNHINLVLVLDKDKVFVVESCALRPFPLLEVSNKLLWKEQIFSFYSNVNCCCSSITANPSFSDKKRTKLSNFRILREQFEPVYVIIKFYHQLLRNQFSLLKYFFWNTHTCIHSHSLHLLHKGQGREGILKTETIYQTPSQKIVLKIFT